MNTPIHTPYKYLEQCYDSKYSTEMNLLIDTDIVKTFMLYLNPNEKIVWTAKAGQGLSLNSTHLVFIPFSIIWLFMTGSMFSEVWQSDMPVNTGGVIMFCIFIAIGIYSLVGHFIVDMIRRSNIVYAMSEQRIFIRSGIFTKELDILTIHQLTGLKLQEKSQNIGTIQLSPPPKHSWLKKRNHLAEMAGYDGILKFEKIEKVREVYGLIGQFQIHNLSSV